MSPDQVGTTYILEIYLDCWLLTLFAASLGPARRPRQVLKENGTAVGVSGDAPEHLLGIATHMIYASPPEHTMVFGG